MTQADGGSIAITVFCEFFAEGHKLTKNSFAISSQLGIFFFCFGSFGFA